MKSPSLSCTGCSTSTKSCTGSTNTTRKCTTPCPMSTTSISLFHNINPNIIARSSCSHCYSKHSTVKTSMPKSLTIKNISYTLLSKLLNRSISNHSSFLEKLLSILMTPFKNYPTDPTRNTTTWPCSSECSSSGYAPCNLAKPTNSACKSASQNSSFPSSTFSKSASLIHATETCS